MSLSFLQKLALNVYHNRWKTEFSSHEEIGKGGFAAVFKAKNYFDENFYAIKRIKLKVKDLKGSLEDELERVLNESKFLARVNHQNVLRYYNSWLEVSTKTKTFVHSPNKSKDTLFSEDHASQITSEESINMNVQSSYESCSGFDTSAVIFEKSSTISKQSDTIKKSFESTQNEQDMLSAIAFVQDTTENKTIKKLDAQVAHNESKEDEPSAILEAFSMTLPKDQILDSILLFIQTELCSETLGDYLSARNEELANLKDPKTYQEAWKEYLKEALAFSKQILEGVSHIHSQGIIHRDLKPQNIFLMDKVCKIGDFGLIKQNGIPYNGEDTQSSVESDTSKSSVKNEEMEECSQVEDEVSCAITGGVGTKMYASPEQWEGDKEKFDYKADIYSLGIILLLLFHPMRTSMEQMRVIQDCKNQKLPTELEQALPDISGIIKKMLSIDPQDRPSIEEISQSLKVPLELNTKLCGSLILRRENCSTLENKYFRLLDESLYIFKTENDKKAESFYVLAEWKITFQPQNPQTSEEGNNLNCNDEWIVLEDPLRLGCSLKAENQDKTIELFKKLKA